MEETHSRSLAKAFSWRFIATIITTAIVWILTGEGKFAATVGLLDTTVKILVYFFHERLWLRIPFGKRKPEEFTI
ncbi:MAG: hypothetical protein A2Y02_02475 [Omnitrophica bacterium GWA2_52_12]|nr:MAG: hypothetical protein A2Y02_02475 [Omnitrophica bacterium GWA2_52_12]